MTCGLIFGSFNPIHNAHLQLAIDVLSDHVVDRVSFIPAKQNPFKPLYEISDIDRINMIRIATNYYKSISYNLIEFTNKAPSCKTYDIYHTIKDLSNGLEDFVIICGKDMYEEIPTWYHGIELLKEVEFYVFDRDPSDISSSLIKEKIRTGQDFQDLVPEAVYKYIKEHNLYVDPTETERIEAE